MISSVASSADRSSALAAYDILDTLPEQVYDDIVLLAAQICGTPIASITFLTAEEQWHKAVIGMPAERAPLEISFCIHTIESDEALLMVPDAYADSRFRNNPLVTGDPHIRFYAGVPLVTSDDVAIGTLCVIDREARTLTTIQQSALQALARQVGTHLELRRTVKELSDAKRQFQAFMDNSPAVAFMKDADGRMRYVNRLFLERFSVTPEEVLGKLDDELWPAEIAATLRAHDRTVLAGDATLVLEEQVPLPSGDVRYWQTYKFPITLDGQRVLGGMGIDMTEVKQYEHRLEAYQQELERALAQIQVESVTDRLTELKNRRAFDAALAAELAQAGEASGPVSLLLLDVDHFKSYNDTFGHPAGDELLRSLAGVLTKTARGNDIVARYGGEEFALVLPATSSAGALRLAERVRRAVERCAWPLRPVTVSVGVATTACREIAPLELLTAADRALYAAKGQGRNCAVAAPELAARC